MTSGQPDPVRYAEAMGKALGAALAHEAEYAGAFRAHADGRAEVFSPAEVQAMSAAVAERARVTAKPKRERLTYMRVGLGPLIWFLTARLHQTRGTPEEITAAMVCVQ